jgi:uncharacterized protein RhaS with RHS repeats
MAETGLNQNWNRDYDPLTGKYVESDPKGLAGGSFSTYAYAGGNPISISDFLGLDTSMVCRPLDRWIAQKTGIPLHCSVFVWHWSKDCPPTKIIDAQFTLPRGATSPTSNTGDDSYIADRLAFTDPSKLDLQFLIAPPAGTSQTQFDQNVIASGRSYSQGSYDPYVGPNSNTAAAGIITGAGGTVPNVPGAFGQHYDPNQIGIPP